MPINDTTNNSLSVLSLNDLETLIQAITRRILRNELHQLQTAPSPSTQTVNLLATFNTWDDDRPIEAIIADIYDARSLGSLEA